MNATAPDCGEMFKAFSDMFFLVHAGEDVVVKSSEVSEDLVGLMKTRKTETCAFLTACNPLIRQRPSKQRDQQFDALLKELKNRSLAYIPASCRKTVDRETQDKSVLVLGISLEASKTLAKRFHQRAVLWCDVEGKVVLSVVG